MPKTPHAPMPPVTAATLKETASVKTVQILVKSGAIGRRIPETKSTCAELVLLQKGFVVTILNHEARVKSPLFGCSHQHGDLNWDPNREELRT